MPTIGLAVVNFDNNQHAVNENLRVGHFWEAIEIFAALVTMNSAKGCRSAGLQESLMCEGARLRGARSMLLVRSDAMPVRGS